MAGANGGIVARLLDVAKSHFDVFIFLVGVLFILVSYVSGISTADGYRIIIADPPHLGILLVGLVICGIALVAHFGGRNRRGNGEANEEAAKYQGVLTWRPDLTTIDQGTSLPDKSLKSFAAGQLKQQQLRLESQVGDHPLVAQIATGRLDSTEEQFEQRARDLYTVLSITNKSIVKYIYKHLLVGEISVDQLLEPVKKIDDRADIGSERELLQRVLLLAASGLIDVSVVGSRRTNVRKISQVGIALAPIIS